MGVRPRRPFAPETTETKVTRIPIAIDSPPPPQQTITERHYVSYENDTHREARSWAAEQVVRKYPGATDIIALEDKLIEQFIAGKGK